jgi:hypothetical protein
VVGGGAGAAGRRVWGGRVRGGLAAALAGLLVGAGLAGCAAPRVREPWPRTPSLAAVVEGEPVVRGWGDEPSPELRASLAEAVAVRRAAGEADDEPAELLALTGGGINGAFGAGFLVGWSEAGTRPRFDLVTGISAGGLLAPFAFLGEEADERLRAAFLAVEPGQIYRRRGLFELWAADSLLDTEPLAELIEHVYDDALLARIGEEHRRGRRLWVGTVNLDARRPVVWDLGALAARGTPGSARLFRQVLRATSAVPGVFAPVYLRSVVDGSAGDEMHVDGGVANQVFGYGVVLGDHRRRDLRQAPTRLWVLRNGRPGLGYEPVAPRLAAVAGASLRSLTHHQGDADLYRLHAFCARDGVEFRYASMPPEAMVEAGAEEKTRATPAELFELGRALGREGEAWRSTLPGF